MCPPRILPNFSFPNLLGLLGNFVPHLFQRSFVTSTLNFLINQNPQLAPSGVMLWSSSLLQLTYIENFIDLIVRRSRSPGIPEFSSFTFVEFPVKIKYGNKNYISLFYSLPPFSSITIILLDIVSVLLIVFQWEIARCGSALYFQFEVELAHNIPSSFLSSKG